MAQTQERPQMLNIHIEKVLKSAAEFLDISIRYVKLCIEVKQVELARLKKESK